MTGFAQKVRERIASEYRNSPLAVAFIAVLGIFLVADLVLFLIYGNGYLVSITDEKGGPRFMDHFFSMVYSIDEPYSYWHVIYPPFITAFYGAVGRFCLPFTDVTFPGDLRNEALAYDFHDSWTAMALFAVILAVCLASVYLLFRRAGGEALKHWHIDALFFVVLLSTPFVYAVARGNSVLICLMFVILFILGYRSENKWIRYASYLALACSVGVKIVTVFFGLLLVRERRWKDTAVCFVMVVAVFFLPFLVTGGSLGELLDCIFSHLDSVESIYSPVTVSEWVMKLRGILPDAAVDVLRYAAVTALLALVFITVLFDRKMAYWKQLTLLSALCVVGLGVGIRYYFVLMAVPLIYFLTAEKEMTVRNVLFVAAFMVMFVLVPSVPPLMSLSAFAMIAVIIYDSLRNIFGDRRRGKV